jgi:sugar lactone lactonase YvrE
VGGTEVFFLNDDGNVTPFARLEADPNLVRLNDAKCDPEGRLWLGTLTTDFATRRGALYRIDPDGKVTTVLTDVALSNGLDWSPDAATFYYIDSSRHTVDAFDFDAARASLSRRRTVVTVPFGEGVPDGMTVDREGRLWVALAGSGEIRCYTPDGTLLARVVASAPVVTSCAFGGIDGADLFITSAALRLPERFLAHGFSAAVVEGSHRAPGAGGLFVCRPGTTGKPGTPFAG